MKQENGKKKTYSSAEEIPVVRDCTDIPMLCIKCGFLLAFVDKETRSEIRVKWRELYIKCVDPLEFTILCRSCGQTNSIHRIEETLDNPVT